MSKIKKGTAPSHCYCNMNIAALCLQVLEWVLSYDGVNQPEPLAITAAGAALLISGGAQEAAGRVVNLQDRTSAVC
jgi:hypothetical protein